MHRWWQPTPTTPSSRLGTTAVPARLTRMKRRRTVGMERNSFVSSTTERGPVTPTAATTRPRVEGERATEIHEAVIRLLIEHGYDRLTFDAVAADVRASKATLYRKWPTKAALVVEAVVETVCPSLLQRPDSGSLRGDLVVGACQDRGLTAGLPALLGAVMPALHRDAELYSEFQVRFL